MLNCVRQDAPYNFPKTRTIARPLARRVTAPREIARGIERGDLARRDNGKTL